MCFYLAVYLNCCIDKLSAMKKLLSTTIVFLTFFSVLRAWNTPSLSSPSNNSSGFIGTTFDWNAVVGSQSYQVEADTVIAFSSPHRQRATKTYINSSSSNTDTEHSFGNMYFGKVYYWRVRAYIPNDTSAWSTPRIFNTLDAVTLQSPSSATTQWTGLTLDWSAYANVSFYDVQCDTALSFNSPALRSSTNTYVNSSSSNTDTEEYFDNLYFGKTYYWRVRARTGYDTTQWGTIRNFITADFVTLTSPASASTQWTGLTLDWSSHTGVDFYDLQCDTSLQFNSPALRSSTDAYVNSSSSNTDTDQFFDNLYFGKTYYWRVRARNAVDTSAWSTIRNFITADFVTLTSPASASTQWTGLTLDWSSHTGVDFYDLQCDTSLQFNSPALRSSTDAYINSATSNTDTDEYFDNLYFGKTYYWRVRARNAVDTSVWSTIRNFITADFVTLTSPASASTQWTGLTLDWSSHTGVDFYDLQYDTSLQFNSPALRSSTDAYINSATSNTDTDEFLDNLYFGKTYYWRVRARNAVDTSAWSTIRNFITADFVTLTSPASASTQWTGLTLDWSSHTGVDFYDMQCDTSLQFNSPALRSSTDAYINSATSNIDTDEFLNNLYFGKTYYWRVRARNAVDTCSWSTVRNFITADYVNLTSPSNAAINQSVAGITLDWAAHTGIITYQLQIDTVNLYNSSLFQQFNKSYINSSSSNSDTQQGTGALIANRVYFWRVRAINGIDTSAWTERWFSTGNVPPVIPGVPALSSPANWATAQPVSLSLVWFSSANASTFEYELSASPNFTSFAASGSVTALNVAVSGLQASTTYYWRVRGRNGNTVSAWSAVWRFSTSGPPSLPVHVSPADAATGQSVAGVLLDWNASLNATDYNYEYATNVAFTSNVVSGNTTNTEILTAVLQPLTTYYWRVQASNGSFVTAWTTPWSFTTQQVLAAPSLVSPANATASVSVNGIALNWTTVSFANAYEYQYSTTASFSSNVVSGTLSSTTVATAALSPFTTYYWRIRATDGNVFSPWSTVWSYTTEQVLAAPSLVSPANTTASVSVSGAVLNWNAVSFATSYEYQYSTDATFNTGVVSGSVSLTTTTTAALNALTIYYWRIRATDGNVFSPWSVVWSFTTEQFINTPTLFSPADMSTGVPVTGATLVWNSVPNGLLYEYEYSTDPNFITGVVSGQTGATVAFPGTLLQLTTYYWRVRASDGVTFSSWSVVWQFTTDNTTGIADYDGNDVQLFPVPCNTQLVVQSATPINWLMLTDLSGRTMLFIDANNEMRIELSTADLPAGIYLLRTSMFVRKVEVIK
jgi:hypothetical protein